MNTGFDMSVLKQPKSDLIKKIAIAVFADVLIGFAIAFNACVGYGNDAISVLYDGVHNKFAINLGLATNLVNLVVFIVVLIFGRKYINIGTLIYVLPLGFFVNLGINVYNLLHVPDVWYIKAIMSVLACSMLFLGVAFYIAIEIGVDQWTGLAMLLRDKTNKDYRMFRVLVDSSSGVIGWLLGGTVGVTTVVAMLLGGPVIQYFSDFICKYILKVFKFKAKK